MNDNQQPGGDNPGQRPGGNNPGQQPGGGQPSWPSQGQQTPGPYPPAQPHPGPYPPAQPYPGPPAGYGQSQSGYGPPSGGYASQPGPAGYGPGQQQYGYGPPSGYQQTGFQGGGPPPQQGNSRGKIIGIVIGAIVVLALIGVAIGLLTGGKSAPVTPIPPPVSQTPDPVPTPTPVEPSPDPTPEPTDPAPTPSEEITEPAPTPTETETPPVSGAIDVGNGMSVVPAEGWTVDEQSENGVLLFDAIGRGFVVSTGQSTNPAAEVAKVIDDVTAGGSDVKKGEVQAPDLHPDLEVASQLAIMTTAGGGGTSELAVLAFVSARTADNVGFVAVLVVPVEDLENKTVTDQADLMLDSLFNSQLG